MVYCCNPDHPIHAFAKRVGEGGKYVQQFLDRSRRSRPPVLHPQFLVDVVTFPFSFCCACTIAEYGGCDTFGYSTCLTSQQLFSVRIDSCIGPRFLTRLWWQVCEGQRGEVDVKHGISFNQFSVNTEKSQNRTICRRTRR